MFQEALKIVGMPTFILTDQFGNVKQKFTQPNLVVTSGKNVIADRLIGTGTDVMSHMAVGTSSAALAESNTALSQEVSTVALTTSTRIDNTVTFLAEFGAGVGTGALVEAGIFNAEVSGAMLCRTTFPVINKEPDDILSISWNVTIN